MCGIAFWNVAGLTPAQIEEIKAVWIPKLAHRGPDGTSIQQRGDYLFGFHRLAIINLEPSGMQPFDYLDADGRVAATLVCNGEIWNYAALAETGEALRSDVDVIHRVLVKGSELSNTRHAGNCFRRDIRHAVNTLDGDFAFAYVRGSTVVVARDPVGVRPLFYGVNEAGTPIAFASEAKALVGAPCVHSVSVFPPGHVWTQNQFVPYESEADAVRVRVRQLLTAAVQKRLDHSDRPVGLLCSGGVDSAIITTLAARMRDPSQLHVFTMEYDTGTAEDTFYAKMLCARFGYKHTVVRFSAAEAQATIATVIATCETYDPNTIRAAIPMYLLAKHIAEHTDVKVVLSGEGADELFAGYLYFNAAPDGPQLNAETRRLVSNIHMFDLLRADRCFAAFGLEVRVPFLDRDLVAFVSGVDGEHKRFQSGVEKLLLREAFADLTALKELRILDRPKEKFSDGCGFSYVPQLLNYVCSLADAEPAPRSLDEKLAVERAHYMTIYEGLYGTQNAHLIVSRTLPAWSGGETAASRSKEGLLAM